MNKKQIMTINAGSSSLKFAVFEAGQPPRRVLWGGIDRIGQTGAVFQVKGLNPTDEFSRVLTKSDHQAALEVFMIWVKERGGGASLSAVGHRMVQGGPQHSEPEKVTHELVEALFKLSPYDPEHMPMEILIVDAFHRQFPNLSQVVCFDTAFHHDMPLVARLLPIPRSYEAKGIHRYGFHGISYAYLMEELSRLGCMEEAEGRVILAHLGNGASLAAVLKGKSVDTSMGFTPSSGVLMGTRSGDLDPGLALYLEKTEGMDTKAFNTMVNFHSGLLGVSGTSPDMRDLLKLEEKDGRAAEAVSLFCYQVKKWIGSFAAALGGLDTLVFSAGIGENCPAVRERICEGLGFLGIELDKNLNSANKSVISVSSGKVKVFVIRTDEELMIAKTVCHVLRIGFTGEAPN
jgi:acetate kinase